MKFDVVIGNPPYQISDGGAQASAGPVYNYFIEEAISLKPEYISMIVPSRWFSGGKGLTRFRRKMLKETRFKEIHDFHNARDCFPSVEIKGGVNYFIWNKDHNGPAKIHTYINNRNTSTMSRYLALENSDIFVRYNEAIPILNKIKEYEEDSFSELVSSRMPFGLATNFNDFDKNKIDSGIKLYANRNIGWLNDTSIITRNREFINEWKLFIPKAIGSGDMKSDVVKPIIGEPQSVSTDTYLMVGPFKNKTEAKNVKSYIETKFFHFLMGLRKITQDASSKVYSFIPVQDFSIEWTDVKLYDKYKLTEEERNYIETQVRDIKEME